MRTNKTSILKYEEIIKMYNGQSIVLSKTLREANLNVNNALTANVSTYINAENNANNISIWTGTAAEYTAVSPKSANTLYFVSA